MIDLETLGTKPNSAIVAIGVAVFDEEWVIDTAYWPLAAPWTGEIDSKTILWWMEQSKEAQQVTFSKDQKRFATADAWFEFVRLNMRYGGFKQLWANDPDFDLVMLKEWLHREQRMENHLRRVPQGHWPFDHKVGRSMRTIRELAQKLGFTEDMETMARGMYVQHSAVEDAAAQARAVIAMEKFILNGGRV